MLDAQPGIDDLEAVVDSVMRASRALVGVAATSLASVDENVTIPQLRALVLLASRGARPAGLLAADLGVHASTVTRLCDRLVAKGLIARAEDPDDRRVQVLSLTARGRRVVRAVTKHRRARIASIVGRIPPVQRAGIVAALEAFGTAADEPSDAEWSLEWPTE